MNMNVSLAGCALLMAFGVLGCTNQGSVDRDAELFCEIHELHNWEDVARSMKFDEFSQLVKERVKSVVKTPEFKQLVDELDEISHYRSMYPVAKKRVAEITGKEWHCPPYEQFYRVTVERVGLSPPLMKRSSEIAITITAEGAYLFEGVPLDLSSEAELKSSLFEDSATISVLTVILLPGAEDDLLEPLFRALAPLGVERVSVVSAD